jgi:uncharacterized protein YjbJ (UPF0337 family)
MNSDTIGGNWKQLVGKAREKWGKLTDSDWEMAAGKKDQIVGKIQEHYGITRDEAHKQYDEFEREHSTTAAAGKYAAGKY